MIDSPLPTIEALRGVATIGSTIVAVGNNGTVLNSTDGITWNRIPTALTDELWQLASSGKDLVIASNRMGVVWTSADGWNWIPRPTGLDGMMYWLNWCNGRYVGLATIATGRSQHGAFLTSLDGIKWTRHSIDSGGFWPTAATWTGKIFIAAGKKTTAFQELKARLMLPAKIDEPTAGVSVDGKSWTLTPLPIPSSQAGRMSVAWNGRLAALICGNKVFASSDGIKWTEQLAAPKSTYLARVVWTGSHFFAVGRNSNRRKTDRAAVYWSTDGITWTSADSPQGSDLLYSAVWTGSQFVAVGVDGVIQTSPTGEHWTKRAPTGSTGTLRRMCSNGSSYVAVGSGTVTSSQDGRVWNSQVVPEDFDANSLVWNGSQFVTVGNKGRVFTSRDGARWIRISMTTEEDLNDIVWTGKQFVCVGTDSNKAPLGPLILSSADGAAWSQQAAPEDLGGLHAAVWTGKQVVAVGELGSVVTSGDGSAWTKRRGSRKGMLPTLEALAYSGDTFVAVGRAGAMSGDKAILCSPDGITWTERPGVGPILLFGVTWAGDRFFAVGERGVVAVSTDGFSWGFDSITTSQALTGAFWDGKRAYAVGHNGVILSTTPK